MRRAAAYMLIVGAVVLAFTAGSMWQARTYDAKMKHSPCMVRYWNPNEGRFRSTDIDKANCLMLGSKRAFTGLWKDQPVGDDFISPDKDLPQYVGLSLPWPYRLQIYQMAGVRVPWQGGPSMQTYQVSLKGRFGSYAADDPVVVVDAPRNVIVVDEVLSAKTVPSGH